MRVAKWVANPTTMLNPRRLIALFLSSVLVLSVSAQTAPIMETAGEKLSLEEAIRRALDKNFSIKISGFESSLGQARLLEAWGKFDPVINGRFDYSESFNPELADATTGFRPAPTFSKSDSGSLSLDGLLPWGMTYQLGGSFGNSRGTFNNYADNFDSFAGLTGRQPLLRNAGFSATLASIRIAQVNRNISQWFFRQTVMSTITNVITAYHTLNLAHASMRSAERSRALAMTLVEENRRRFQVGSMSEYDVTFAESRAATRDEGILIAQNRVREAENALKQLIMDDKTTDLLSVRLAIEPPPPSPIVMVDPVVDFRTALEKRPDYQQAKLELKRDNINTRFQRNQLLPRVDLVGSYGYNGYDSEFNVSRRQVRNEDYRAYSWGVVVSVPLTFTTERGRYRAAKLAERQSETDLARTEQNIVVAVGNAANLIETAQKRVQSTRRARELAQYTLDAELKRLRAGTSTSFQVANQQELFSAAEVAEARAKADYAIALAVYDRELGVTLEKLNITVEPPK
jgi:outer membrane protein